MLHPKLPSIATTSQNVIQYDNKLAYLILSVRKGVVILGALNVIGYANLFKPQNYHCMKRVTYALLLLTAIIATSCGTIKTIPLKGNYPTMPTVINSNKHFEEVWDKLIDLFAQKGLSIKVIDRSSGLIVSDRSLLKTTIEDTKGIIEDPTAWVVVPKEHNPISGRDEAVSGSSSGVYAKKMIPNDVIGDWNVRIKKNTDGTTSINVNIVNVRYEDIAPGANYKKEFNLYSYKSTGVFENLIYSAIK